MPTRDEWYTPNSLYNIHWRSQDEPAEGSRRAIVIKQHNPSVCTCHHHCSDVQYRMDTEIVQFSDEYDKLRKFNEVYKACSDDKVKLMIPERKKHNTTCDTTHIESTLSLVDGTVCVQGTKDLIGLSKTRRKFSTTDHCHGDNPELNVDNEADKTTNQVNTVCKLHVVMCEGCNTPDVSDDDSDVADHIVEDFLDDIKTDRIVLSNIVNTENVDDSFGILRIYCCG